MIFKGHNTFKWTIKNFDMCPHATGEPLESPEFEDGPYKFRLCLYPRGHQSVEYISVFLLNDCGAECVLCDYNICIINDTGLRRRVCFGKGAHLLKGRSCGFPEFIERYLLLTSDRDELLPRNNLTIQCSVSTPASKKNYDPEDREWRCNVEDSETLSRDFAELLKNGIHSDMTIQVGGSKFKVNRAILACRCPQLTANLKETTVSNEFTLPGIEPPVLQAFLQYLYSGTFREWHLYKEIFVISDTYKLLELRNELIFSYPYNIHASTEINVSRATFKWVIADFSKLQLDQELVNPIFCYTTSGDNEMKIILSITKRQTESEKLELKFHKISGDITFIRFKISFFVKDDSVAPICVNEYSQEFKNENWTSPLDLGINLSEIIFNDILSMFFEISFASNSTISKFEEICIGPKTQEPSVKVFKDLTRLQNDMEKLRSSEKYSDVTLCVEGKNFLAHRAILCARSPVFAKMFENDTLEKNEGTINIRDVDSGTVSDMLWCIYSGCTPFPMTVSQVISMYAAADKYELLALKDECATFLKSSDEADHVGDILLLGDRHHDESLKKSVCDYIAANPKKVLRSKKGFDALKSKPHMYLEILKVLLEHLSLLKDDSLECFEDT